MCQYRSFFCCVFFLEMLLYSLRLVGTDLTVPFLCIMYKWNIFSCLILLLKAFVVMLGVQISCDFCILVAFRMLKQYLCLIIYIFLSSHAAMEEASPTHAHICKRASRSAPTLLFSIISTDLQVTDKAYNIRSKLREHNISLTLSSAPLPLYNFLTLLFIITCFSVSTFASTVCSVHREPGL